MLGVKLVVSRRPWLTRAVHRLPSAGIAPGQGTAGWDLLLFLGSPQGREMGMPTRMPASCSCPTASQ